jgi:hypothetical protein
MSPSQIASMLGKLAAGKPKRFSRSELRRRAERLAELNRKRAAERKKSR